MVVKAAKELGQDSDLPEGDLMRDFILLNPNVEGEQKLSGLTFCSITQQQLLLESKTKLEVKTNGQEI